MEFAAKDKLARLEEDRQRRRKQRAADALLRIDAVGKQTLQLLQENALQRPGWSENPEGAAAQHEDGPDAGRLSRVLLEAAGSVEDPRRAARRNKRANRGLAQRAEERATRGRLDHARQSIENAIISTTGSGLKEGLEAAARQVHDVVSHVSTFARGVLGMPELAPDVLDDLVTEEHGEDKAAKQPPVATLDATRETDPTAEFAPRDALGARGFEMTLDVNKPPRDRDPDLIPASDRAAAAAPRDLLSRHRGIASFAAHRPLGGLEDKLQRPFLDTTALNASLTAGLGVPGQTAGGSSPGILLDLTVGGHRPATPAGAQSDGKPADATAHGNVAIQAQTEGQGGPGRGNFALEAHAGPGERSTAINAQTDAAATGAAPRFQAQHIMAGPTPAVDPAAAGPQGGVAAQGPQVGGPGAPTLHAELGIPGVATLHAQVGTHGAATLDAQVGGPTGAFPGQLGGPGMPGAFPGQISAEVGIAAQPAGAVNASVLPGRMHAGAILARSSVESDIAGPEGNSGSGTVQRHSGAIVAPSTAAGPTSTAPQTAPTTDGQAPTAQATTPAAPTAQPANPPTPASDPAPNGQNAQSAQNAATANGPAAHGQLPAGKQDPLADAKRKANQQPAAHAAGAPGPGAHGKPVAGHAPAHPAAHAPAAHAPAAPHGAPALPPRSTMHPASAAPTHAPHSATPAAARRAAAEPSHPPKAGNKAPVSVAHGGAMSVQFQKVQAPPAREVPKTEKEIVQPSFQIESKGQSPALPTMPTDLASQAQKPAAAAPPPPAAAPKAAATTSAPTARRAVPALPAKGATPAAAPNPALAAGRSAAGSVNLPKGTVGGAAAGIAAAATAAAGAAAKAHPGASAVKITAPTTQAPPTTPVPKTPMTPSPTTPQVPAPQTAAPQIPAVPPVSGGSPPNPSGMVPSTVSLGADRSAAQTSLTAESQTQNRVGPEAQAQRASEIAPLNPVMQQTEHSGDAPRAAALSSATSAGTTTAGQGHAQDAAAQASGRAQIAGQMQGAAAERAQAAGQPPPAILAQTSPSVMQGATSSIGAAVANAAHAVSSQAVQLHPQATARAAQATSISSTLPAFNAARFAAIDQHAPLPALHTTAMDGAQATAAASYQQSNQQISQLSNVSPPVVQMPAGDTGGRTNGGHPTREAAIAGIESQISQHANAAAPAQMHAAAAPVQSQLTSQMASTQTATQQSAAQQVAQHQSHCNELTQGQPPVTGAQAAAQAQPEYQSHQAEATAASTQMGATVTGAQTTATTATTAAQTQRNTQVTTAQTGYQQQVSGQLMPQYANAQTQAHGAFQTTDQTAQTTMGADQQTAQTAAQVATDAAHTTADTDISTHQTQLTSQQTAAATSHDQQVTAANTQHQTQVTQAQQQSDQQVQQHQTDMTSQVSSTQSQGQTEVNQHLSQGETEYHATVQQGQSDADAARAKGEQEAAAKKQQADAEKSKHSGGFLGSIVGWVKDRVNDLLDAAKAVLEAAKNLVISIMEKARQAAMAVLEKARQAALAVLNRVKSAIQGIISACASAIRSVISACASLVRGLIQTLANVLKSLVQALTTMLTTLVKAFQAAVNAVLDGLIAAVSLVNKDLGNKLRAATQKYRDAFNSAMNKLSTDIQAAGTALQAGIQKAADNAIAVVDAAEKTLNDAVTAVENTLNAVVEAAYQLGAAAINTAFDAAEAAVNKAFDVAEAAVTAYFDAQIAAIGAVQKAVDAVADFVVEVANKALEALDKIAQAIVDAIPDSWTKALVDFWNGPWRTAIIIGLATIAAVAITAATLGTGAPIAAMLLAGVIGGAIAGTAYFGGEMLAREGEIKLSSEGDGMYIPGYGKVQIGPDGKPIPPAGLSPDKMADFEKQSGWAVSNFNLQRDANGQVTGYDRKSGLDIADSAVKEGIKGFGEGFISGALAVAGGGVGGALTKSIGNQLLKNVLETGITNVITGPIQTSLTTGWDAGFDALSSGKSPLEALKAGWGGAKDQLANPGNWANALLMTGISPIKLKVVTPGLDKALGGVENTAVKTVVSKGTDVVVDTMGQTFATAGSNFVGGYYQAIKDGKSPSEALAAGRKSADEAFDPAAIATTAFTNTAGAAVPHPGAHETEPHTSTSEPHTTEPTSTSEPHTTEPTSTSEPHTTTETHTTSTHTTSEPHTTTETHTTSTHTTSEPHATTETHSTGTHTTSEPTTHAAATEPTTHAAATEPTTHAAATEPHTTSEPTHETTGEPTHETTSAPTHETGPNGEVVLPPAAVPQAEHSLQEQVERVTGVDQGAEHEQAMSDLRDYYNQQNAEGQNTIQVSGTRSDGPYSWSFGHDATEFSNGTTHVEYRVYLDGATHNIPPEHMQQLRDNVVAGVDEHYNYQHDITNSNGDPSRLHMEVVFVDDPAAAHTAVTVHSGDGPADLGNWYVDAHSTTHAHEIGHGAFGFADEYRDGSVPNRATDTSPGVHHDDSLMANYWEQQPDGSWAPKAGTGLQDRHIDEISGLHNQNAQTGPIGAHPPGPEHPTSPTHDANTSTHELENQLAAIDYHETGTPESIDAVRAARGDIAALQTTRDNVVNSSGEWEHATPQQREQQLKLIDDQIRSTAENALDQHAQSQPDLAPNAPRTPDERQAHQDEVKAAREQTAQRDAQLVEDLHANTIVGEDGAQHIAQVFDHVTLGGGFAGVSNEMSRPGRTPEDIVIGGKNPWDGATSKFGQPAGDSELPHPADGHSMKETARDPDADFMDAADHADNVALNRNDAEIKSYDGQAGALEPGPQDSWPQFAKDGGATVRTAVTGPDGEVRYVYSKGVDVAAGPGPNRRLPESVMDADTFDRMHGDNAIAFGDQGFQPGSVNPGEVGNLGPGAAGAWVGEAAGGVRTPEGTRASDVEWIANKPRVDNPENTPAQKAEIEAIYNEIDAANASGDPDRIQAAKDELTRWTFEEAPRNGNLPRNREEGGSFSPEMQKGYADTEAGRGQEDGPISRRVTDGVAKVTYEPQVEGGPDRVKITLKDVGPDGQPVVIWKDSLVLSIGQDAKGPGGPVSLLENYRGQLEPIYGPTEPDGFRPVVGVQSPDGSVRVLGSAATPRDVSEMLNHDELGTQDHQDNLKKQADRLDENSAGVVPGFVLAEKTIRASNEELTRQLQQSADEQRTSAHGDPAPDAEHLPPAPARPGEPEPTPGQHLPPAPARPGDHEPAPGERLPPAPARPGEPAPHSNGEHEPTAAAHDTGAPEHETAPLPHPLENRDAVIEQLAHGMVDGELTPQDEAFLAANGYRTEAPVRGEHEFVMRVFYPTEEGKPPIIAFRGTVPEKPATVVADLDPRGIGMWQYKANEPAIRDAVARAQKYGPVVFSGHSLGGALAQTAASRFPGHADSIVTFQAPGVPRGTARAVENYNAANPTKPVLSSHHRVAGDLVPYGGRALTPGTIHNHEMQGGNVLSRHLAYPLGREQVAAGHDVPHAKGNDTRHTGDETTEHDNATKPLDAELLRKGIGTAVYGPGLAANGVKRLFTGRPEPQPELPPPGTHDFGSDGALPPAPQPGADHGNLPPAPRPGESEPAHDGDDHEAAASLPHPLENTDAVIEQLAHGMVDAELTPEHEAFLAANGYAAEPPIRGDRQFVMRVFVPTEEGKPPIIAFRGTVANPLHPSATFHTLAADADPRGIGVYQLTPEANRKAINETVQRVSDQYGPVVFAGHSLGGALAQTVASRFPGQADRIVTFQAPGVPHETAQSLEHYNADNPDSPVTSSHHRVAGDFVPTGGEALTPGTVHNHEMPDAGLLGKHTSYPLGREETAAGHDVPFHKGKDTRPTGDETTEQANSTKDLGKERARTRAGAMLYGPGLGLHRLFGGSREPQLPGTAPHELPPGTHEPGTHEPGSNDALPPAPLHNREAVIEQLAHGMVDGDLTPQDEAFLAANGYRTEAPISGPHQFVMRVFYPTEEGKPPIVAFRGTVPKKLATVGADLDPRSIGMWQYNANEAAIRDAVERASPYGKIVFSGHSLGGALAQTAASRFPGKADSIVTFQAPGVSRDIVGSVEDYNAAHPDSPVLSSHHRVTGDLVPKGGRAVTPGTIHNHEMEGGNALSRHLAYPLGREQVEDGNDVPYAKGGAMHHTGDESAERANATKNQTLENVRKGVGAVFYGPGLTIKGIANGVRSGVSGIKKLFHRPGDRPALPPGTEHRTPGVRIHQPDTDDQTAANDALPPAPHPEDAGHDADHSAERTDTRSDVSPPMPRPLPPVESQQAVEAAAIFVRNVASGRVEHSEVVDGTGLAPQDLANRIDARMTELGQRYGSQRYEVYWEGFSSRQAVHRTHPELG